MGGDTPAHLTLGHSPDPDDAYMWWPITGMVSPDGSRLPGAEGEPLIDTGRFSFEAVPADIEQLNRRAAERGDLDITALSFGAYPSVADRYALATCGASMGDGYGPKLVTLPEHAESLGDTDAVAGWVLDSAPRPVIAIPGARTTAYMTLRLLLGGVPETLETRFDEVIGAVTSGRASAGLIIHEGQLTYADAGLVELADLGVWWTSRTGGPLPLGANAIRRDLDERFGGGATAEVAGLLSRSVEVAMRDHERSVDYAMRFAMTTDAGVTRERVERFIRMYVNDLTLDPGEAGREAVARLLRGGAEAGLCADPGSATWADR